MNKKNKLWLPLIISLSAVFGMMIGFRIKSAMPGINFFSITNASPLDEITTLIKNKYVDSVNIDAISDTAILSLLSQLDPHSSYIPANELAHVNEEIKGSFYGIGIEFSIINDSMHVTNIIKNGPAEKSGLKIGDKLISANDSLLSGKNLEYDRISRILKGELNSKVKVKILRSNKNMEIEITRGLIPIKSIDAAYMIDDAIGFIRINRFSSQTYSEFMTALKMLKKSGLKKLILDLRDNGGGVLDEAVEIADEFLSQDKLITYTEGTHFKKAEYRCKRPGEFETGELIALVNGNTASASEILLGALQDWDRATIVGQTSFGKGLVQEQYNLSDNSALRLTIARYYTPVGRSIQRSYANGNKAYYADAIHRQFQNNTDTIHSGKSFKTMGGKSIFANGGIEPDLYVAIDSLNFGTTSAKLYSKGIIGNYGYRYYLKKFDELIKYKSSKEFIQGYKFNESDWSLLKNIAIGDSIKMDNISNGEKQSLIKAITLSIARQLYQTEGYFEIANKTDETVQKSIERLKSN